MLYIGCLIIVNGQNIKKIDLENFIAFGKAPRRESKSPGLHGRSRHYVGHHECSKACIVTK